MCLRHKKINKERCLTKAKVQAFKYEEFKKHILVIAWKSDFVGDKYKDYGIYKEYSWVIIDLLFPIRLDSPRFYFILTTKVYQSREKLYIDLHMLLFNLCIYFCIESLSKYD